MSRHRMYPAPSMRRRSMKFGKRPVLVAAAPIVFFLLASAGTAQAETYSLQQLIDGATFTVPTSAGNSLVFQNFSNYPLYSPGARQPGQLIASPSQIFATVINAHTANPGLLWQSAEWSVTPTQFINTAWTYDVVMSDGSASISGSEMTLGAYSTHDGVNLRINSSLASTTGGLGDLMNDPAATGPTLEDDVSFDPTNSVNVLKDVNLHGFSGGNASLSTFTQTFFTSFSPNIAPATPEPGTTAMLLGMGISGSLLAFRRRRRRRRQA